MTDAELDAALRALTAIDADPRMPARVLRVIEEPRARFVPSAVWPAGAGVAAAVILLMTMVTWRAERPSTLPSPAAAPLPVTSAALAVPGVPGDVHVPVLVREAPALRHAAAERPWPYSMPALERESPLAVDRIHHVPLPAPALGVEPLLIAQLEIESLER